MNQHNEATQKKISKVIDHKKRIKDWCILYFSLAAADIGIYLYSMITKQSFKMWWIVLPWVLMAILAAIMLQYKNKLSAGIFFGYFFLFHVGRLYIESMGGGGGLLTIVSWIGFVGIFQCWISATKLSKT